MKKQTILLLLSMLIYSAGFSQAVQAVNVGAVLNDGMGDLPRAAFIKVNRNVYLANITGTATGTNTYSCSTNSIVDNTVNTYTLTSYVAGQHYTITFTNGNTGPSTLTLNGLGVLPLVKQGNVALSTGDILAGETKELYNTGTALQMLGGGGSSGSTGTVTSVSVATANGVSAVVTNPTTTPSATFTLGAITPSSVNGITLSGSATPTLAVTGTSTISGTNTGDQNLSTLAVKANNLSDLASASTARTNLGLGTLATQNGTFSGTSSGTNTGDQTSVSGNAGTATALQNARLINGVSFDGTANITITDATKIDKLIITNRQTASYTLVLGDANKIVEQNVGSANNLTVPANATVAYPIGTQIMISQYGAGQTTIVPAGSVSVRSEGGKLKICGQYAGATLTKIATDEWYLFGCLTL